MQPVTRHGSETRELTRERVSEHRQPATMLQQLLVALLLCPVGTAAQPAGFVRSWLDAVSSGAEVPGV